MPLFRQDWSRRIELYSMGSCTDLKQEQKAEATAATSPAGMWCSVTAIRLAGSDAGVWGLNRRGARI